MKLNFPNYWLKRDLFCYLLSPLAGLYRLLLFLRQLLFKYGFKKITKFNVPVIIVGNITVGGTGKTPLVIWLVELLRAHGFNPGVVSRGYGGGSDSYPLIVTTDSKVSAVGDEALLIFKRANCPVVVAPDRVAAVRKLLQVYNCNCIVSDDGLQHYALGRDVEIVVVDGIRKFGNGFCLPAGPLREPKSRLHEVNFVLENGVNMQLIPGQIYNLLQPNLQQDLAKLSGKTVHAIAGIGNPERFFKMLQEFNIKVICHPFPDHYDFCAKDINFNDDILVVMTEKDAVKCMEFANDKCWCVPVKAEVDSTLQQNLLQLFYAKSSKTSGDNN